MSTQISEKKILQIVILSLFFILIIAYSFFRSKYLIVGVQIKDVNLTDGATMKDSVVELTGNAKNATDLILNGREISINEDGDFHETFALLKGYNVINITAKDKFGYVDEKNYKLIYNEAGNTF